VPAPEPAPGPVSGLVAGPLASLALGAAAALAGALAWALIADATDVRLGILTIGIGVLVGLAMTRVPVDRRWLPWAAAALTGMACVGGHLMIDLLATAHAFQLPVRDTIEVLASDPALAWLIARADFEAVDLVPWGVAVLVAVRVVRRRLPGS